MVRMKLEYDYFDNIKDLLIQIKDCEGKHRQQVSFSTYHSALTQVCFDCKKVRSMLKIDDVWANGEKYFECNKCGESFEE